MWLESFHNTLLHLPVSDLTNLSIFKSIFILYSPAMGGALSAGTVFGWSSPAEIPLRNRTEFGFPMDDEQWSWIGSTITLGAAATCAIIGTIINLFGRKRTMLAMVAPFLVGWALVIWSSGFAMLLAGRLLLGMSGGAFFVMAPMYIGEIAQKDIRGALGSFFQLMVTIGILFVYILGYVTNVFTFSIVCACLPLLFALVFVTMPESPLWLVSRNRTDAAISSLQWLRGNRYDYTDELTELQDDDRRTKALNVSVMDALRRPATKRALIIIVGLMFFLQLSGINIVIFYTASIFEAANTGLEAELATIIVGVMQVLATFVASMIVDKVGRRVLLLISVSVMAFCKCLLGIYFTMQQADADSVRELGWLPVVALCLYIVVFSLGFGPIPWLMVGELFAPDIKGIAGSAAGSFSWLFAFAVTKSFASLQTAIGAGPTFFLLAGFSVAGTVFVWFVVPETKGKSLADIQIMLAGDGKGGAAGDGKAPGMEVERSMDTGTTASVTDLKI